MLIDKHVLEENTRLYEAFGRALREGANLALTLDPTHPLSLDEHVTQLREAVHNSMSGKAVSAAQQDKADLYNAHSSAAHRTTTSAYSAYNKSMHKVGEEHHKLAKAAADDCVGSCDDTDMKKAYGAASKYHGAQASAHSAAHSAQKNGNSPSYGDYY